MIFSRSLLSARFFRAMVAAMLVIFAASGAMSQEDEFLLLEDYPNAKVILQTRDYTQNYILALSSYRKIGGEWGADRQRRLSGHLSRRTLELPANHSARDGYRFYLEQLQEFTLRELFTCVGRECGPSSSWAANHFRVLQLYGQDQHQSYGAFEVIDSRQQRYYVSLYSVMRGNRRVYVQVDVFKPDPGADSGAVADASTLYQLLRSEGYFVMAGFTVSGAGDKLALDIAGTALAPVVELLKQNADLRVALVGHDYGASDLDLQRKQSRAYADYFKAALVAQGIEAGRLEVHGLGSDAPAGRGEGSARLEVVLLPRP
jgi:hypothetical protein